MIAKASCLQFSARMLSISPEFRHKATGISIHIDRCRKPRFQSRLQYFNLLPSLLHYKSKIPQSLSLEDGQSSCDKAS